MDKDREKQKQFRERGTESTPEGLKARNIWVLCQLMYRIYSQIDLPNVTIEYIWVRKIGGSHWNFRKKVPREKTQGLLIPPWCASWWSKQIHRTRHAEPCWAMLSLWVKSLGAATVFHGDRKPPIFGDEDSTEWRWDTSRFWIPPEIHHLSNKMLGRKPPQVVCWY